MTTDTTSEAARVQAQVLRRLGGGRRFELACRMSELVRALALARIRSKEPGLDEIGVRRRLIWELYGARIESR